MEKHIHIDASGRLIEAVLNDTDTAHAIWEALPIESECQTWGKEIYFSIPVHVPLEIGARQIVERGTLGYWPTGHAFCIFWGPTPASKGDEIRAASEVNIIGQVTKGVEILDDVEAGTLISVRRAGVL
jgi:hypothetical protein